MISFLTADANVLFTTALAVMVLIGFLEGIANLIGMGFSNVLDTFFPHFNIHLPDGIDGHLPGTGALDTPIDAPTALTKTLGWLRIGKVPLLMLIVVFLCAFGLIGLGIQATAQEVWNGYLPVLIAAPVAFAVSLPVTRIVGGVFSRIVPQEESSAISEGSFVGRSATVITGTAKRNVGAQAKLRDQHGQTHYVMVQADNEEDQFPAGTPVLLVRREGPAFRCIKDNTSSVLTQEER